MPRTSKDEAAIMVDEPVIEGRYVELDDWTVSFERFPIGSDPSPVFRGLPDDRCQCLHLGYVKSGQVTVNYKDSTEILRAGDASASSANGTVNSCPRAQRSSARTCKPE